jgi:choline dehydrogenase
VHDYVIVGAGTAGSVLAHRLSAGGDARVLLLARSSAAAQRRTIPQPALFERRLPWTLDADEPGAATDSTALCAAPAAGDAWAAEGGWDAQSLQPPLRRLDAGSPPVVFTDGGADDPPPLAQAFVRAAVAADVPYEANGIRLPIGGVGLHRHLQHTGRSVAAAYRHAARERPNLTVIGGARVRRIDIEDGRAVGVSYVDDGLRWSAEAERAVVLCGGPVATPHLLMRSGIGPPQHLRDRGVPVERARPGVGRGLRDPLAVRLTAHADGAAPPSADGGPVPDASAFVQARSASPAPDLQLAFEQQGPPEREGRTPFAVRCTLLAPQSRGRVRLRPDTGPPDGPVEPPVLDPQALTAPADGAALIEGLRRARRVLRRLPFTRHGPVEAHPGPARTTDDALRAHIRLHAERAGLPSGTCRMGPSGNEGAVVDDALRVHGFAGRLRVADASVLPAPVRLTGPLPLLLLAERAAALVRR